MLEDACSIALLNCCGLDAIPDLSCAADYLTCLRSLWGLRPLHCRVPPSIHFSLSSCARRLADGPAQGRAAAATCPSFCSSSSCPLDGGWALGGRGLPCSLAEVLCGHWHHARLPGYLTVASPACVRPQQQFQADSSQAWSSPPNGPFGRYLLTSAPKVGAARKRFRQETIKLQVFSKAS